jgi:hypothetical protein
MYKKQFSNSHAFDCDAPQFESRLPKLQAFPGCGCTRQEILNSSESFADFKIPDLQINETKSWLQDRNTYCKNVNCKIYQWIQGCVMATLIARMHQGTKLNQR